MLTVIPSGEAGRDASRRTRRRGRGGPGAERWERRGGTCRERDAS